MSFSPLLPNVQRLEHVNCSVELSVATHMLSAKHVHMSVQDLGQKEG